MPVLERIPVGWVGATHRNGLPSRPLECFILPRQEGESYKLEASASEWTAPAGMHSLAIRRLYGLPA